MIADNLMSDTVNVPRVPTEAMLMAARGLIMARDLRAPNGETTLGDVARSGFYGEHWRDILTDEERAIAAALGSKHTRYGDVTPDAGDILEFRL